MQDIRPNRSTAVIRFFIFILALSALIGCAKVELVSESTIKHERHSSEDKNANDLIVVFPHSECLEEALNKIHLGKKVVFDNRKFQEELFPWFEPEQVPSSIEKLEILLNRPKVKEKIDSLNVRFLVTVTVDASSIKATDLLTCGGGASGSGGGGAAVGCLGYYNFSATTNVMATIWDFERRQKRYTVNLKGDGFITIIGLVLPIPIWSDPSDEICAETAQRLINVM